MRIAYGTGYLDKKYAYNMKQAEAAGVPTGTYVYSLATTTAQALKEAQLAIQQMQGYKVSYPVVFDLEYSGMGALSKQKIAQLAKTFCDEVKKPVIILWFTVMQTGIRRKWTGACCRESMCGLPSMETGFRRLQSLPIIIRSGSARTVMAAVF